MSMLRTINIFPSPHTIRETATKMNYSFAGKVVIITGSSSGIGAATAIHFAKLGASLSLTGRNEANLKEVVKQCAEANGGDLEKILTTVGDITNEGVQKKLIDATLRKYGAIHVLVNNAGIALSNGNMQDGSIDLLDKVMDVNVRSVVQLSQLCMEPLKATKGCVVNVSSVAGRRPSASWTFYSMSKAALDQFTQCLAAEMAPFKVRVNAVNPAVVRTPIFAKANFIPPNVDEKTFLDETLAGIHPLGRIGEPNEIAIAIAHLAHHEMSAWTTGILMPVDGGALLGTGSSNVLKKEK